MHPMTGALRAEVIMRSYPVFFDVQPPEKLDRLQVALRLLILFVLGMVGVSGGWVFLLLYLALPAAAAIVIQSRGPERYLAEMGPRIAQLLRWLLSLHAYMAFLTDRFPLGEDSGVKFEVTCAGSPTPGSATARVLTSLPEAIALALLALLSGIVWLISLFTVLISEKMPGALYAFQRGFLRWEARLFAYHASLVEPMPPFELATGRETP